MSDVSTLSGFEPRLNLLPNEVDVRPEFEMRPYSSSLQQEKEHKRIEKLATSLDKEGQFDDCVITEMPANGNGLKYVMVMGHRRRKGGLLLNERRTAEGRELFRLRCRLMPYDSALVRKALASNIERENLSPMDLALKIQQIKKENGWEGFKGDKSVASYIGVSTAQVTQHLKFLEAPSELRDKLALGELSAESAFDLLSGVKPEHAGEAVEAARVEQVKAAATKALKDLESGKKTAEEAQAAIEKASTGRIESPAVRKAIKEMEPDKRAGAIPLNRKELLETFDELDSPLYGHPDSAVRVWVRYFVDKYATGEGTNNTMLKHFDRMVEKADKGTAEASKKAEAKQKAEEAKLEKEQAEKAAAKAAKQAKTAKKAAKPAKAAKPVKDGKVTPKPKGGK